MNELNRRSILRGATGAAAALGVGRALHNTVIGYGRFGIGDNLQTQNLNAIAADGLRLPTIFETRVGDDDVSLQRGTVRYQTEGDWAPVDSDAPTPIKQFQADVKAIQTDAVSFTFHAPEQFFAYVTDAPTRAGTVELLRWRAGTPPDPGIVRAFVGTDPADGAGLVRGLVHGFRDHTYYDVPRYIAGSVQDNLLPIALDLRAPFRPTVSFEELLTADRPIGLFCTEYVRLANRAIASVPASNQTPPIVGLLVRNRRHKHVFNAFASAIGREDGLEIPMTFVDYTYTTLYDDLKLTSIVGEGFDAYGTGHRADVIQW